jgi:carbon starvation protein CstA
MIWRYFAWANQTLSVFTLWAITVYLVREKRAPIYYVTFLPALFMTAVCTTYICVSPEGLGISPRLSLPIGICSALIAFIWFHYWLFKTAKKVI